MLSDRNACLVVINLENCPFLGIFSLPRFGGCIFFYSSLIMKSKLIALGLACAMLPSFVRGQQSTIYEKSVFSGFHKRQPVADKAVRETMQQVQQQFPGMQVSVDKLTGNIDDMFGVSIAIPGSSIEDKVRHIFSRLSSFGIRATEWTQTADVTTPRARYINFTQSIDGHKVAFAVLKLRFTTTGELARITMSQYGAPDKSLAPSLSAASAQQYAVQDLSGVSIAESTVHADWSYFPVPEAVGYSLRPAYAFHIKGETENLPVDLTGYVDAVNGSVLYRTNGVKETVTQTVQGSVYKQNPLVAASAEPLANLKVTIGSTDYYTDTAGVLNIAALNVPVAATMKLEGLWSKVRAATSGNVTPNFSNNIAVNGLTYVFPVTSPSSDRHVNAYYHVNRVHDFMKKFFPSFTTMDYALNTNVDVTSGNCNAFYTGSGGSSINFYAAGNGCNSFADCGDIIYHEYGHGISDKYYAYMGKGTIQNGALNEANSDIWGISITKDPVLGKGSMVGGGIIRRYDQAPKVYPADIVGEVHADGEIIAGAWWDVAVNLNSVDTMTMLFTDVYNSTPDGPNGTEGPVYHKVLVSALLSDDNDNNLLNGTPHFAQIVLAFAKHGIYLLGDAKIGHSEIANQPENTPINISATLKVTAPGYFKNLLLHYRPRGGQWDSLIMQQQQPLDTIFTTQIPAQAAGTIIDYYMTVVDTFGMVNITYPDGYSPLAASSTVTIPYQFGIGFDTKVSVDFETPVNGWSVANNTGDNATAGKWIIAKPVGSYVSGASAQIPVQPNMDHTTGTTGNCLVTANAGSISAGAGTADVDSGRTSTITQMFDISDFVEPVVEYWRWFSNDAGSNPGQDYWSVFVKDSVSTIWFIRTDYTKAADNQWRRRIFNLRDYLPTAKKFQIKFQAEDASPASTVEAAVDDIVIYEKAFATGIGDHDRLKASIFPNPAGSEIHVRLSKSANGYIALYDLSGRQVVLQNLTNATEYSLNTSSVASGTYFVTIKTEGYMQSHKVSVIH